MRVKKDLPPIINLQEHIVERTGIKKLFDTMRYVMKSQKATSYRVSLTISPAGADEDG
ncbi:MAG: hypothetical protein IJ300_10015 [Clostridia bacterium]|nr:hypothetical protein [Clostridia bacterium]